MGITLLDSLWNNRFSGGCENTPMEQIRRFGFITPVRHDPVQRTFRAMLNELGGSNHYVDRVLKFDPFVSDHRIIIDSIPTFMRPEDAIVNRIKTVGISGCRYGLYRPNKHDIPKVYFDKTTKTWSSKHVSVLPKTPEPRISLKPECELFSDDISELIRKDLDDAMYKYNLDLYNRFFGN